MKTFFDPTSQEELLIRLDSLSSDTTPYWGKMNAAQMLAHCAIAFKTPTGEVTLSKTPFFLRLLGRMIKKSMLSEKPYSKNSPTAKEFLVRDERDFQTEKRNFQEAFQKLSVGGKSAVKVTDHSFFGSMSADEWGRHIYKHTDYHFGQFGV